MPQNADKDSLSMFPLDFLQLFGLFYGLSPIPTGQSW